MRTTLTVAMNVYGGTITSSPGPTPKAPSEVSSAVVPLAVATQYLAWLILAKASSNSSTDRPRYQRPDATTSPTNFSVADVTGGQEAYPLPRTGFPPKAAGLSAPWPTRVKANPTPAEVVVAINLRRLT